MDEIECARWKWIGEDVVTYDFHVWCVDRAQEADLQIGRSHLSRRPD
jgi:hypothetical protein